MIAAAATIELEQDGLGYRVLLRAETGLLAAPLTGSLAQLRQARASAVDELTQLKARVTEATDPSGSIVDWAAVEQFMNDLDRISTSLWTALLEPNDVTFYFNLLAAIRIAIETVEATGSWPFVDFVCPIGFLLPFELLQVDEREPPEQIRSARDLAEAAGRFAGFRATTRTALLGVPVPAPWPRDERTRLRMMVLRDASLEEVASELAGLGSLDDVEIVGVLPVSDDVAALVTAATDFLIGETLDSCPAPCDVLHFSCHCRSEDALEAAHELSFNDTTDEERSIWLTAAQLDYELVQRQRSLYSADRLNSLRTPQMVFANACGSARLQLDSSARFPRFFVHRARVPAFIGPLINVPDRVAATFSQYVYWNALDGDPIAVALARARREFLYDRRNPLGIAYTLFGSPECTV